MVKWRDWFSAPAKATQFTLPVDFLSPEFIADPAPIYEWLRVNHPIAPTASGGFVLTRHADILAAFSNPALGNAPSRFSVLAAKNKDKHPAASVAAHIPPFLDKPEHVEVRQVVSKAFFEVYKHAPDWVAPLARDTLSHLRGKQVDLIADVAAPYTAAFMARFVGLSSDQTAIKQATSAFFHLFAPIQSRETLTQVNNQLSAARAFISRAVEAPEDSGVIAALMRNGTTRDAVIDNALLLLSDGVENIEAGIASCFLNFSNNRDQIGADTPVDVVVREGLRLSSPGQVIPRVAREATTLLGQEISVGMPVFLALGSANLDPEAHRDPLTFRLDRDAEPHLTFGRGRHSCIGASLAQLQISAMLSALIEGNARILGSEKLGYHSRFGHRWLKSLPVQL